MSRGAREMHRTSGFHRRGPVQIDAIESRSGHELRHKKHFIGHFAEPGLPSRGRRGTLARSASHIPASVRVMFPRSGYHTARPVEPWPGAESEDSSYRAFRRALAPGNRRRTIVALLTAIATLAVIGTVTLAESTTCAGVGLAGTIQERIEPSSDRIDLGDLADGDIRLCGEPIRVVTFDGAAGSPADPAVWNHELGGHGWGNQELQSYTDSTSNAAVDGSGNLLLTARRESYQGADGFNREYTSARLTTQDTVLVSPGSYVEATIRAPVGSGVWPAFWLIGADIADVGWPASGELDVMEIFGNRPNVVTNRIHLAALDDPTKDMPVGPGTANWSTTLDHPLDASAHRFGVYFDGDRVQFYLDRQPRLSYTADEARASGRTWPFGRPQFIVLNVAVGSIAGDPSETDFPKRMTVSPIAIWRAVPAE